MEMNVRDATTEDEPATLARSFALLIGEDLRASRHFAAT